MYSLQMMVVEIAYPESSGYNLIFILDQEIPYDCCA